MQLKILYTKSELEAWINDQNSAIILIPTMGGLHAGHQFLIRKAKETLNVNNPIVLVSIFVNPLQFSAKEDFEKYPRNLKRDSKLASDSGADAIWAPNVSEVFPGGEDYHFKIQVPLILNKQLCGANRQGHFDGVATVIIRLIKLIQPATLILGEKDWQQLLIIRKLFQELSISTKIESYPTFRDKNGLAYSSRNSYLSNFEKEKALALPQALKAVIDEFNTTKTINLSKATSKLKENDLEIEYLKIVDAYTLKEREDTNSLCLLAAAVRCGTTRLIDHTFLMKRKPIIAIDGPAGAGKSTVTKEIAKKLGLIYLDTGSMYRAVTWLIQRDLIDLDNKKMVDQTLKNLKLEFQTSNEGKQNILINDIDITEQIRSPEVTSLVSKIASIESVREALTSQQKSIGNKGGIVAEERDIGTVVFPDAEVKVFLTASPQERARRRYLDLQKRGYQSPRIEDLEREIKERDLQDTQREIAPLIKAEDAIELITDGMNIKAVITELTQIFRSKIPKEIWPTP